MQLQKIHAAAAVLGVRYAVAVILGGIGIGIGVRGGVRGIACAICVE